MALLLDLGLAVKQIYVIILSFVLLILFIPSLACGDHGRCQHESRDNGNWRMQCTCDEGYRGFFCDRQESGNDATMNVNVVVIDSNPDEVRTSTIEAEPPTEAATEATTERATEAATEATTEATTEAATEAETEEVTTRRVEAPTSTTRQSDGIEIVTGGDQPISSLEPFSETPPPQETRASPIFLMFSFSESTARPQNPSTTRAPGSTISRNTERSTTAARSTERPTTSARNTERSTRPTVPIQHSTTNVPEQTTTVALHHYS